MKKMFIYKSISGDTLGSRTEITSKSGMYAIAADLIARPEIDCVYCSSQQDKQDLVSVINDVNANGLSEMSYSSHNINVNIICDESIFKDTESKKHYSVLGIVDKFMDYIRYPEKTKNKETELEQSQDNELTGTDKKSIFIKSFCPPEGCEVKAVEKELEQSQDDDEVTHLDINLALDVVGLLREACDEIMKEPSSGEEKDDIECSTTPINKDYEIGDE
jgi:hypothetical protein